MYEVEMRDLDIYIKELDATIKAPYDENSCQCTEIYTKQRIEKIVMIY
jgi:hypothetical protein